MLGGADNPNGELPSYITGANIYPYSVPEIVFSMRCIVAVFPH